MQTFRLTFGSGSDAVNMIDQGENLLSILQTLQLAGWQIETVTAVTREKDIDFPAVAKELKAFTAANNHTEALLHLADVLEDEPATAKLTAIQKEQDKKGHLTMELSERRFYIYQSLMDRVKLYGPEAFESIHSSL